MFANDKYKYESFLLIRGRVATHLFDLPPILFLSDPVLPARS